MRQWTEKDKKRQTCVMRRHKPWRKSTGPRTQEGKEKSKYNAVKHGRCSAASVRMRKAFAAQGRFLKQCEVYIRAGLGIPCVLRKLERKVTNELLRACVALYDPPPVLGGNIEMFSRRQAANHDPPPEMKVVA